MGKNKDPYYVNMEVKIDDLQKLPEGTSPAQIFMEACIGAIIRVSKQSSGLSMQDHRKLYRLRDTFKNAIDCKETARVEVEHEDYRFLWKCWNDQRPEATVNELIMRVERQLKAAFDNQELPAEEAAVPPEGAPQS